MPSRAITEGEFIVTYRGTFPYPSVHFEPFLEKFHSNRSSLRTWYTVLGLPFGNLFASIDYAGNRIGNFNFISKNTVCVKSFAFVSRLRWTRQILRQAQPQLCDVYTQGYHTSCRKFCSVFYTKSIFLCLTSEHLFLSEPRLTGMLNSGNNHPGLVPEIYQFSSWNWRKYR